MYVDDVTFVETVEDILDDLSVIREAEEIGLTLNDAKSGIICMILLSEVSSFSPFQVHKW